MNNKKKQIKRTPEVDKIMIFFSLHFKVMCKMSYSRDMKKKNIQQTKISHPHQNSF